MFPEYSEYIVEYDEELLMVYLSGLTPEGYWEEICDFDDINDPESFAHGYQEALRADGKFCTVMPVLILHEDV
ncbi:hypothetical protein EVB99_060 [Rhizobium phage RHph_N3_19]|nr:hypothetical protein EVB99_060 [Rhizobium phage RHph_N3_19]